MRNFRVGGALGVIIILILIVFIVGGAGGYFYMTLKKAQKVDTDIKKETLTNPNQNISFIGPLYSLEPFNLKLRSVDGSVEVKVELSLELSLKELQNELIAKKDTIRKVIVDILTTKSLDALNSKAGRFKVSEDIIQQINKELVDGKIINIYFLKLQELNKGSI